MVHVFILDFSGGTAACLAYSIIHPFQLITTRLQVQDSQDSLQNKYTGSYLFENFPQNLPFKSIVGFLDAIKQILKEEGFFGWLHSKKKKWN